MVRKSIVSLLTGVLVCLLSCPGARPAVAAPVPGGTLDPTKIPKYVAPLFFLPEMPKSLLSPVPAADYDIAVRQFKQQILPAPLPATTVWGYGQAQDIIPPNFVAPAPLAAGVTFN